jgi:hypothetical protein
MARARRRTLQSAACKRALHAHCRTWPRPALVERDDRVAIPNVIAAASEVAAKSAVKPAESGIAQEPQSNVDRGGDGVSVAFKEDGTSSAN